MDDEEDVEEVVDEMEPESEGEQSGWRAWECLGELAMVCVEIVDSFNPGTPTKSRLRIQGTFAAAGW